MEKRVKWTENVILADADHVDRVAFNLIVNFERMLNRRIPQADLPRWIDCVALDGGLREGPHETSVVLIHGKQHWQMDNFVPSRYDDELNGKAFSDHLGEFSITALPVEDLVTADDFFVETLQLVMAQPDVKRLMVIPPDHIYKKVREAIGRADGADKHITVFTMEPAPGGSFRQEILGYSLMAALGIKASEINPQ